MKIKPLFQIFVLLFLLTSVLPAQRGAEAAQESAPPAASIGFRTQDPGPFLSWPLPSSIGIDSISRLPNSPWTYNFLGITGCPAYPALIDPGQWYDGQSYGGNRNYILSGVPDSRVKWMNGNDGVFANAFACYSDQNGHAGTDIFAANGTNILAAAYADWVYVNASGTIITLRHPNVNGTGQTWYTYYVHASASTYPAGKATTPAGGIPAGTVIGKVGSGHLHFQVDNDGGYWTARALNPFGIDRSPWNGCLFKDAKYCPQPASEITPTITSVVGPTVLKNGDIIYLKTLGSVEGPRWLNGNTINATAGLVPDTGGSYTGTRWQVVDLGNGEIGLKCLGTVEGSRWLDGNTINATVKLSPQTTGGYTGTHWRVIDLGNGEINLMSLGSVEGSRYLDGNTINATVGLAPATGGSYTGTRWLVVRENQSPTNTPTPVGPSVTPTVTPVDPTNTPVGTISASATLSASSIEVDQTAEVTVVLNGVPPEGLASAEFVCTASGMEISGITDAGLFGVDALMAVSGPQNGSFTAGLAGSTGSKAVNSGAALRFMVKSVMAGTSTISCRVRVSKDGNSLVDAPFTAVSLTVQTKTITPTASVTPVSEQGALSGSVVASKPVTVVVKDQSGNVVLTMAVNADGSFSQPVQAGTYTVAASADGYLSAQSVVTVAAGQTTTLPQVTLLAGDVNGDGRIDPLDVVTIGANYGKAAPSQADLNDDGEINVLDLSRLAQNYRMVGPLEWK